ncbi:MULTISPECIES: beta-ketoacyl-ACP synthase [unclassified Synechocystis]|uniref:beta-ketoacyl-ACP synthase n=1 Tax=unclassified Synechocystis TaxID=2640012 RepID=UPI0003FE38FC|nr:MULTISPECIES: beta-ketoacyl-ACP synthase [unclassified Synechocystis]AIE75152.1 3-oxoacyl-[acyl-carrier-protein] synthase, KASII [Synechocystis sp. PCC 6714]MCT0252914.1 beta-ketoacyl-ACP synthase [Synechocystis sp. CS-94]
MAGVGKKTGVVVTGIGLRTGLGDRQETWQQLLQGQTAIKLEQPFLNLPLLPLALLGNCPWDLEQLMPDLVRAALNDAQLNCSTKTWGVAIGSSRASQGHWEDWVSSNAHPSAPPNFSPVDWWQTLPDQAARLAAQLLPEVEVMQSPMAACATGLWAIAKGVDLIREGYCQRVLAGAVEAPITPLTLAGFSRMATLARDGCYPFDRQRQGLVLGEGGALLVLETQELAQSRKARIYGEILGWGFSCDALHRSTPAFDNRSAQKAVEHCLARSGLTPEHIDLIHPHGTGTSFNDRREAALIQTLFPQNPSITSSKGATGHTLGASGAIAVALTLLSLHQQKLPPCVGLTEPEFPLNFVGVESAQQATNPLSYGLCLSFGFGGQNGAIAVGNGIE